MKERKTVQIGPHTIGDYYPTAVVAELGVNHLGKFDIAKEMITKAHQSGAHILKFQTYRAEDRYDPVNNPKGKEFIKLLSEWEFPRDQDKELWDYAKSLGATVMTSPFDEDSVKFAEEMGCEGYKVAAFEVVNHKLMKAIAETKKPVVMSRGMCTMEDLHTTAEIFEKSGSPYVILHCISSYPLEKKDSHLKMIHSLRNEFECPIGHSDHTPGTAIPPLAVAAGANMIEKHFTVTPKYRLSDNFFSITPDELEEIVFKVKQVDSWMGRGDITVIEPEKFMKTFRRHTS
jgi:sialic acid synthase SpsE